MQQLYPDGIITIENGDLEIPITWETIHLYACAPLLWVHCQVFFRNFFLVLHAKESVGV
jgi:hypothetical protein